jgi:hypothetical protein
MVYTFACPVPCQRIIKVHADSDDEAIERMIVAGAMSCRNAAHRRYCEEGHRRMPSFSMEQLRQIVRLSMEAESVDIPMAMSLKKVGALVGTAAQRP